METSRGNESVVPTPAIEVYNCTRVKLSTSALVIRICVSSAYIVVGTNDSKVRVFGATGETKRILQGNENIWSLALQGDMLLGGEVGGCINCWDLTTGHKQSMNEHSQTVRCIGFIDSRTAISASSDATLKLWDLDTAVCKSTLVGHTAPIRALALTKDVAVSGCKDGQCMVWSLSQNCRTATLSGHTAGIRAVAYDGGRVFTGSVDQDVRIWDVTTGTCLCILKGHISMVSHVRIQDDTLVTAGLDRKILQWSLQDYGLIHTIPEAHEFGVSSLDVKKGYILSGGSDGTVKLWQLKSTNLVGQVGTEAQAVWAACFKPGEDESMVVALKQEDAFLDIWHA